MPGLPRNSEMNPGSLFLGDKKSGAIKAKESR